MSQRRAAAALALVAALPFLPALSGWRALFQRDIVNYWLPTIEVFVRQVAAGEPPLWNPGVGFGAPLWADPNFQWAYPTTWLNLLLPPALSFALLVASHAALGACGLARLMTLAGVAPGAGLLAGVVFAWSGPWLSSASLWHHYCTVAWAPWVLWALERLAAAPGPRSAAALGATAGLAALAGSADVCLMILLLALLRLPALVRTSPRLRSFVGALAVAVTLAAGLASAQWMPTLGILEAGSRAAVAESTRLYWSLHPASLVDLAVPRLVAGQPWTEPARATLFEGREPLIDGLYLGAGALVLALLAVAGAAPPRLARGLMLAAALLTVLALGRHTPLHPLLSSPGLAQLRYPAKFVWLVPMLTALLAGLGFHALTTRTVLPPAVRLAARAALFGGGGLLTLGFVAAATPHWPASLEVAGVDPTTTALALVHAALAIIATSALALRALARAPGARPSVWIAAVALVDLGLFALPQNALAPPALLRHEPPVVRGLREDGAQRVLVRRGQGRLEDRLRFGPVGWAPEPRFVLGLQDLLLPPAAARWGLHGSFDGDFTGLAPPATSPLTRLATGDGGDETRARLLRLAAVSHVVTLEPSLPIPGAVLLAEYPSVFDAPVRLFRLATPLPSARVVCGVERVADDVEALRRIATPDFDPARETTSSQFAASACPAGFRGLAVVVAQGPSSAAYDVDVSHAAVLVLAGAAFPGWTATIDGVAAPLRSADLLFRAVAVPAGRHRVSFRYWPRGLSVGLLLAALSTLTLLGLGTRTRPDW